MRELPRIMVAPNGARHQKQDHSQLPITIEEVVNTALACAKAGADGLHAHVRDQDGNHILDAGLYRELYKELDLKCKELFVQITTEAVGRYTPQQQREMVYELKPKAMSFAISEMFSDQGIKEAQRFYHWCIEHDVSVQHILYSAKDLQQLVELQDNKIVPTQLNQLLFVLGRYTSNKQSSPTDLEPFLDILRTTKRECDWALCAFGPQETKCLLNAFTHGGKARIGFENNFLHDDGTPAKDNAARVAELVRLAP